MRLSLSGNLDLVVFIMKKFAINSLRIRIIMIFVLLSIALLFSIRYTQQHVDQSLQDSVSIISQDQQLTQAINTIRTGMRSAELATYQYSLNPEQKDINKINALTNNSIYHIEILLNNPKTQTNGQLHQDVISLKNSLERLKSIISVYTSPGENTSDSSSLKEILDPVFPGIWKNIGQVNDNHNKRVNNNILSSMTVTDTLNNFIWLFSCAVFMLLLAGYLVFEISVRKPILQLSSAMKAYGAGNREIPSLSFKSDETASLLRSFMDMQGKVDSRQKHLESILDNAGEGILTIDKNKRIETFNSAAKKLFGYTSEEVVGKEIYILFPKDESSEKKDYYKELFNSDPHQPLPEINATIDARRKNAEQFPLSIKTTNLELDGKFISIAIVDDVSEREKMMKNLRKMAEHDALTGLYNRQFFMNELEKNVERISRGAQLKCALMYIDLDNFKFVNDTLGHLAGDRVLIEVTAMLNQYISKTDMIGRIGGDEFGILLENVSNRQAMKAAEHYRKQLTSYIFKYGGKEIDIGCSIGIALFDEDIVSKEDILARADIACHIAKNAGKNRVHVYKPDDQSNRISMYADIGWARQIKESIEQNKFVLARQPIVDTITGKLLSYEILLRMRDNNSDIILPSGFLPSAQRIGLMVDIDKWILGQAISSLKHELSTDPLIRYSINLSAKAICDPEILMIITEAIVTNQIEPNSITFEITEDTAIANMDMAVRFLHQLEELGCKTALDDFGTGYSSFSYLKDLPVDYVKIDGSFVQNIDKDKLNFAMVKSMNEVAHATGKKTVAEFVKNEDILNQIKVIGIDYAQGFHIGKPILIQD